MLIFNSFFEDLDFDMEPEQPKRRRFGRRGGDDGGRRGGSGDGGDGGDGGDDGGDDVFATQASSTNIWDDDPRTRSGDEDDEDDDGGRRRGGGARGQGLQRLLLLALAIVLVLGIGLWQVRRCQHQAEVDRYKDYVTQANEVAKQSTALGKTFGDSWLKQGQTVDGFVKDISDLATKQSAIADSATRISGPGALDQIDIFSAQAMQLRATGLKAVADAVQKAGAGAGKDGAITAEGARAIVKASSRLTASDAVYQDSFRVPAQAALKDAGIDGTTIEESVFVSDETLDLLSPDRLTSLIQAWSLGSGGGGGGDTAQCDDGKARGTQLVTVTVGDVPIWSNDGSVADAPEVQVSDTNDLKVTLANSGDVTLTQVQVKATIGDEKLATQVVPLLDAGKETTVTFPFPSDVVAFDGETRVTTQVEPNACETNKDNNLAKIQVLFQLGS